MRWIPVVVYAGMIFAASSVPARWVPGSNVWSFDKVIHVLLFAGLAALVAWAWERAALAALAATLYGAIDELHQRFTPGRSSEVGDVLADLAGAAIGAMIVWVVWRRRRADGHPT